jgi:thiamine-monophosphate kinase
MGGNGAGSIVGAFDPPNPISTTLGANPVMFRSETEFVNWLKRLTRGRAAGLALGIGDDAALVRPRRGNEIILTTDLTIEGVHFLPKLHPPRSVGHRALARALSDVAAMGGRPRYALISLALSTRTSRSWVEEFYAGVSALATRTGVEIIGGDTALVRDKTFVDVVVVGEVPRGRALLRSGARPGDGIYVSGRLGLSALGLQVLKQSKSRASRATAKAVRAHLFPTPRLELGRFLQENRLATAMMDLSDGLSTDLARLSEASSVGATLWSERIPAPAASMTSARALELALHGGEDYELLFTVRPGKARRIPARVCGVSLHQIGEVQRSHKLQIRQPNGCVVPLKPGGYDHFLKT